MLKSRNNFHQRMLRTKNQLFTVSIYPKFEAFGYINRLFTCKNSVTDVECVIEVL